MDLEIFHAMHLPLPGCVALHQNHLWKHGAGEAAAYRSQGSYSAGGGWGGGLFPQNYFNNFNTVKECLISLSGILPLNILGGTSWIVHPVLWMWPQSRQARVQGTVFNLKFSMLSDMICLRVQGPALQVNICGVGVKSDTAMTAALCHSTGWTWWTVRGLYGGIPWGVWWFLEISYSGKSL